MIQIYHNPRCGKSRCGLDLVEKSGQVFELIKYLEQVPSKNELKSIIGKLKIAPIELVRKGELLSKEKFKDKLLSDEEIIDAMIKFPILIERPIVINGDKAVIGGPPEKIAAILNKA